ncbi:hypothetical protein HZA99_01730 [Candidatus Woesearchaeota archaeon]|nr:hypothetical protein [Candidatus Woesearchaeota archaeon]
MKGKLFALLIVVLLLNVTLVAALPWWLEWFVKPFTQAQSITGQQVVVGPGGTTCPGTPCQGKQNNDACGFQSICWNCQCVFVGGGGGTTVTPGCDPSFSEAPSSTQSGCGYGASPKVQVGTSCWVKNTFTGQTYTGTCKVKGDYGGFTSATSGTCGCSVEVPTCGNGQLDFGEQCDPAKFSPWGDVNSCTDVNAPSGQKYTGGTLSCNQDCTFNTAQCTSPSTQYCGNGVREGNEGCDGTDVSGCIGSLTSGNKWACETNCWCKQVVKTYCGDGITQLPNDDAQYEVCDNGKGSPDTCGPGTHCSSCLCVQNTSQVCGDGQITGTEVCDPAKALPWGDVLGCTSLTAPNGQKYSEGTLTCSADCKSFNTAQCTSQFCGNNIREGSEQCDGSSPSVQCSIGANKVYAGCSNTCVCISRDKTYCGDGTIQTPNDSNLNEQCEGNNLNGKTCTSQGFTGGTLKCTNCQLDTSACTSTTQSCGNGKKEGTESCDGQDLSGCTGSLSPGKTWTCNTSCVCQQRNKYVCGDQIIGNPTTGSPINENGQAEVCDPGTTSKQVPECPNGYYCSNTSCLCIPLAGTYCGDGTVQSPNTQGQNEKCDPSAPKSSWACGDKEAIDCETGTCQCIYCGDGKDSPSKQCDINPGATVTPGQPVSLAFNSCSGGQICGWQAKAQGQNVAGNDLCGCVAPTISQACGDGQITGTEVCDPGSGTQGTPNYKPPKGCPTNTYCSNTCSTCVPVEVLTNSCGDGKVQQPNTAGVWEQCDEDATTKVVDWGGSQEQQGYARTCKSCQVVYDPICGNGAIDTGEKCDIKIGTTTGARFVGTCSAEEVCGWDVQGKTGAEKCQCYPKPQICGDGILSQQLGEQCELKNGAWDVSTCPTASGQNKYVCGYDVNSQKNCQCINIPSSCNGKYSALEDEGKCDGATQEEANNYCQNNSVCDLNTCNCIPIEESDSCTQSEKTVVTASGQAVKTKITTLRKTGSEFSYSDGNPPPAGAPDIKTHIGEIPSTFSEMCYQCKTSDRPATGGIRAGTLAEVISYYCPIEIKESFCGNGNPAKPFENLEAGEQCDPGEKDTNQEISINKKLGNLGNDYCKGCLRYLCYPTQINGNSGVLYQNYGGEQLFLPNEETPSLRNQQTGELEKVKLSDLTTKLPFTNLNDFELTQTTSSTKKPLSSTCWKCAPPEGEFALQLLSGSSIQKSPTTIAQQLEHLVPQPTECGEVPPPPQICIVNNIKESGEKCDFGKPETRQLPSGSETCTENCEYSKCQEINGGVSYQNFNENTPSIWQNGKYLKD